MASHHMHWMDSMTLPATTVRAEAKRSLAGHTKTPKPTDANPATQRTPIVSSMPKVLGDSSFLFLQTNLIS